jgi:hypothetical protein
MAISRTGTFTEVDSSVQSSSISITIPADAEILVVLVEGYALSSAIFGANSMTINGLAMTRAIFYDADSNVHGTAIYYRVSPPTGSQTLAWSWSNALTLGAIMACVCYKGIDTASPIVDAKANHVNASNTTISVTALTHGANDLTVGVAGCDSSGTPDVDTGGQTKILESATFNGAKVAVAEIVNSGTFTALTCDFPSACAVVLAVSSVSYTPPFNPVKKNEDFQIRIALENFAALGEFKANPTIAAGDFKVDIDGAGFANLSVLPSVSPAGSVAVLVTLPAAEMNGDVITFTAIDQTSPKEWRDFFFSMPTTQ